MSELLTLQGRWWLPENEDHQVFGTLTWDANDGGTLHLHDELQPVIWLDNVLTDGSAQNDAGSARPRSRDVCAIDVGITPAVGPTSGSGPSGGWGSSVRGRPRR